MQTPLFSFFGFCLLWQFLFPATASAQLGEYFAAAEQRKKAQEAEKKSVVEPERSSSGGGFYALGQAAFLLGNLHEDGFGGAEVSTSLYLSAGYNFRSWFQAGMGVGYSQFQNVPLYPVFAEVRGLFADRDFSPYYALRAGHSYAGFVDNFQIQNAKGGFMGEGQLGLSIRTGNLSFLLGGGYHFQKAKLEGTIDNWWGGWGGDQSYIQNRNFRRLTASCSLKFDF